MFRACAIYAHTHTPTRTHTPFSRRGHKSPRGTVSEGEKTKKKNVWEMISVFFRFHSWTSIILPIILVYFCPRYIKVKVEHYLLFMFSPPEIRRVNSGIKYICLHLLPVFYLIQPSSKQIICFDFGKQNSVLPKAFYVPCFCRPGFWWSKQNCKVVIWYFLKRWSSCYVVTD